MNLIKQSLLFLVLLMTPFFSYGALNVGVGKTSITPPIGTPSAGYADRKGIGMEGVHDLLLAIALFIDNGSKQIVFCSVDHLGFTYEMVQKVIQQIHAVPQLENCEIYIGSSHTHSGGGAYLNIPVIGENLAGPYNTDITNFYVQQTVEAIIQASQNMTPSKIGIGYGKVENLSKYRATWPKDITPKTDLAVIKIVRLDGTPLAVLFNYAVHPTVLKSQNLLFSSDFVGYTRSHINHLFENSTEAIYFNGAQGDIAPVIFNDEDRFESAKILGQSLAESIATIYNAIETNDSLDIKTQKQTYAFKPQPTPFGLKLPLEEYKTEINLIVLNKTNAFVTIPGELSTIYDTYLKNLANTLGYMHVSILGLTNDAHGYIILPEAWKHRTSESGLSFGGETYGESTKQRVEALLRNNSPNFLP